MYGAERGQCRLLPEKRKRGGNVGNGGVHVVNKGILNKICSVQSNRDTQLLS